MQNRQTTPTKKGYYYNAPPRHWSASIGMESTFIIIGIILVIALWVGSGITFGKAREQAAQSLRETIMERALQCFAIEGAYPQSLSYLEQHYGLSVNSSDYLITYEAFASNIPPTVMVVPK